MLRKKIFIPPTKKYYYQTNKTLSCRLSSSQCQDIDKSTKMSYVEKLIKNQMIKKILDFCLIFVSVGGSFFVLKNEKRSHKYFCSLCRIEIMKQL